MSHSRERSDTLQVRDLRWSLLLDESTKSRLTIIIVFIVTFTLYGIEGIAEEIGLLQFPKHPRPHPPESLSSETVHSLTARRSLRQRCQWSFPCSDLSFIVDIDMDPLIEDLKSDLRFVLEKIPPYDGVIHA